MTTWQELEGHNVNDLTHLINNLPKMILLVPCPIALESYTLEKFKAPPPPTPAPSPWQEEMNLCKKSKGH